MDIQTARDSIGKEVVLNEDTKPYSNSDSTFSPYLHDTLENSYGFTIGEVDEKGDVKLKYTNKKLGISSWGYISPRHLSLATPTLQEMDKLEKPKNTVLDTLSVDVSVLNIESVELRLAIFNGDTSRTLEEMKEIEAWLLNK